MKKKKIAKYIQEAETPIKPKVLYDKVTWGDMLTENEKTFLRNVLEDESHSKDEGLGIAIEAFALSHTATRENITLVEKFLDEGSFIFKFIPYFMVVAFLLILLLSPVLPNAGIDNISHNVLHISYLKGRIIFAIIILIFHYKFIKTRYLTNKIYSSLTLFLYPILLYVMFHTENPINFIPYFISLYLFNGEVEIYFIAIFDVVLAFLLVYLIQFFIDSQFYKKM